MAKELIRLEGLSKFYTGSQSVVMGLNSLNLTFSQGEFVAITGESGSGKSTLSHVLGGILPYESGEMRFAGSPTSHYDSADWERYRRDHISFISQNYGILPGASVQENVVSALLLTGLEKQEAHAAAETLLRQVELWELRKRRAAKLSSGQKQRLSIARALAKPAPVLIADEPTGNLDPENSDKVIRLLAQAARERLVILVTHEFSEAEAFATRHIIIQEGRVVMDAALRIPDNLEVPEKKHRKERKLGCYVARLQQRSRPVWSVFLAVFFAMTAFAVFAFLGTLIVNLDDSSTRHYDNSVFTNGDPQRIVVVTMDGSSMTQADFQNLANVEYVERLEKNGYVTDLQYAYREHVDHEMVVYEVTHYGQTEDTTEVHFYAKLKQNAPFIQTVPVMPEGKSFLSAGREPENLYEVVAQGGESLLGQTLRVHITNQNYWPSDQTLPLDVTVVGVTNYGSGLYFHEDLGRLCAQIARTATEGYVFLPARDLTDDQFRCHLDVVQGMNSQYVRLLETMAKQKTLLPLLRRDEKVFANVNDPSGSTVTLQMESTVEPVFKLWNVGSGSYFAYSHLEERWMPISKREENYYNLDVRFYPVEDTQPESDGSLVSGRYVIWSEGYSVALSAGTAQSENAAQVVWLDGVLTGFTEKEIWDVEVTDGELVRISHAGQPLEPYASYSSSAQEVAGYWIAEQARNYTGLHTYDQRRLVEVSPNRFQELTWDGGYEQVSLTITDYAYTQRVLDAVQAMGYAALSPYQLGSIAQDPALAQHREQTLLICLLALAAVAVLQLVLLRAMFSVQMESYRLLSNIGLSAKMAMRSVLWQILGFTAMGQLLSAMALAVCRYRGVERIVHILRYLPLQHMVLLMGVHLLLSLAAAWWIMAALKKQVYALTGRESDLPMDSEEKEAAV